MSEIKNANDLIEIIKREFEGVEYKRWISSEKLYTIKDLDEVDWKDGDAVSEIFVSKIKITSDSGYIFETVDEFGGEGQGDTYYYIMKLTTPEGSEHFISFDGVYDSWNGTTWETEPTLVEPYEVMVTKWRCLT